MLYSIFTDTKVNRSLPQFYFSLKKRELKNHKDVEMWTGEERHPSFCQIFTDLFSKTPEEITGAKE